MNRSEPFLDKTGKGKAKDGKPAVEQKWKNPQLACYFSTPVPVGDHLYMVTGNMAAAMQRRPGAPVKALAYCFCRL